MAIDHDLAHHILFRMCRISFSKQKKSQREREGAVELQSLHSFSMFANKLFRRFWISASVSVRARAR